MKLLRSDIYENLKMALATLRSNKLRSALTVVGVVIGVWTVMAIASIISGIDTAVKREVEQFGTRSIFLYKFDIGPRTTELTREERMRPNLTYEDTLAIRELSAVESAFPFLIITNQGFRGQNLMVKKDGKSSAAVQLEGTTAGYDRSGIVTMAEARFFVEIEDQTNQTVCVIGSSVADNFFPFGSPVGETIDIGGQEFRVVGVMQK